MPLKEESWTAKNMAKSLHNSTIMKGNIEMLLRTVISVNQLSICGAWTDLCKELDKNSFDDSADDPSEDSESSGTLCAKEILEMRRLYRVYIYIYIYIYI